MPALASPSTWRSHPHRVSGYLYAYNPDVVFSCSINQATFSYPVAYLTYDTVTLGTYTDVVEGMTVRFKTAAGAFLGWGRIRAAATNTLIVIGAIPSGDITFSDDDVIEVLNDYRIWSKIPRIDATNPLATTFYKDYEIAMTWQGTLQAPVSNCGPHVAGFVADDGYLYVSFRGASNSYAMTEGATIASYTNDIGDGTYVTGDATSGDFDAKFPPGVRWVSLTVTDSNDISHTSRRFIAACQRTGATAPARVQLNALRLGVEGASAEFMFLENDGSTDVVPENTLVLYFEEEAYDTTDGSLNSYDYANVTYHADARVKFVGWVSGNADHIEPLQNDLVFRADGPAGILANRDMFSQSVFNNAAPTQWHHMANLTLFRFIWYLLYYHTTALDVCDLIRPAWYASYPYNRFDVSAGTAYGVANDMAHSVNASLSCDRMGIFYLPRNPQYMVDADRDTVATVVTLEDSDWSLIDIDQGHQDVDYWVRGSGLLASSSAIRPFLSIAPGKSPGQAAVEDSFDNQLVENQLDLNVRTGRHYGVRNTRYPSYSIAILNAGNVVEPAWLEWIQFTLRSDLSKRAVIPPIRALVREVNYTYDTQLGTSSEQWTVDVETFGTPGETILIPEFGIDNSEYVGLSPHRKIRFTQYDPRKRAKTAPNRLYLVLETGVYCTSNADAGAPTWTSVGVSLDDDLDNFEYVQLVADPFSPRRHAYALMNFTDAGQYKVLYCEIGDQPNWNYETILDPDVGTYPSMQLEMIAASPRVPGSIWVSATNLIGPPSATELGVWRRPTDSDPFEYVPVFNVVGYAMSGSRIAVGHTRSTYGTSAPSVAIYKPGDQLLVWYRSIDGGETYTLYHSAADGEPADIVVPFDNNGFENRIYLSALDFPYGEVCSMLYSNDAGTVSMKFDPGMVVLPASSPMSHQMSASAKDSDRLLVIVYYPATLVYTLEYTDDNGATWTRIELPSGFDTSADQILAVYGYPWNDNFALIVIDSGAYKGLWQTTNFRAASVSWSSVMGNLALSTINSFVGMLVDYV